MLSRSAAELFIKILKVEKRPILGFATGETPKLFYEQLVMLSTPDLLNAWKNTEAFNLDEYIGLPPDSPYTFRNYMYSRLYRYVPIPEKQIHIPNSSPSDPELECIRFTEQLKFVGKRHVQLLGIGRNGHIGFNEPSHTLRLHTHIVQLSEETRKQNAAAFPDNVSVPSEAITMGIGDIMDCDMIVLLAFGPSKRLALTRAFSGTLSTECPASFLQLHRNVIVFTDQENVI